MSTPSNFFYCPFHQIRFRANTQTSILCEQGGHELGHGFPKQSWWKYCCDCGTFWPIRPEADPSLSQCIVCERNLACNFVCVECDVISVESAAVVRRKQHWIDPGAGVKPECPGCNTAASTALKEHDCRETGMRYLSGRDTCPFCGESVARSAAPSIQSLSCWSCGAGLIAPFRFCKRCGKAQHDVSLSAIPEQSQAHTTPVDVLVTSPLKATPQIQNEPNHQEGNVSPGIASVSSPPSELGLEWSPDSASERYAEQENGLEEVDSAINFELVESKEAASHPKVFKSSGYVSPWEASGFSPRRQKRPHWIIAGGAVGLSLATVVVVVLLYSNHRPTTLENNSNAGVNTGPKSTAPQVPRDMVLIAGGQFLMGSNSGDEYEKPAHNVSVAAFLLDKTEVTCENYMEFIKATGHRAPPQWVNGGYPSGSGKLPVTGVDWYDASAFAQWANKRLPTEEEWEFAARAGDGRRYPWGNSWLAGAANTGESTVHHLMNVGSFPNGQTPSGLMDMTGNAWEWTASQLAPYPNGKFSKAPLGEVKVIRGGSWQDENDQATTTYRGYLRSSGAEDYSATGFRCAADVRPTVDPRRPSK